jgi:hypothetical protein
MLLAIILILVANSIFNLLVVRYASKEIAKAKTQARAFIDAGDDGNPRIVGIWGTMADILAQRLATSVVAVMRGQVGGTMKAINSALEQEAVEANPAMSFAAVLPKKLQKNPLALMGLNSVLNKILQQAMTANKPGGNNSGEVSQTKFDL